MGEKPLKRLPGSRKQWLTGLKPGENESSDSHVVVEMLARSHRTKDRLLLDCDLVSGDIERTVLKRISIWSDQF
jgi:hypothetical protein